MPLSFCLYTNGKLQTEVASFILPTIFSFLRFFICKINNNWFASLLIEYSKLFTDNIHQLSGNKNFNIKFEMEIEQKILFYSVSF